MVSKSTMITAYSDQLAVGPVLLPKGLKDSSSNRVHQNREIFIEASPRKDSHVDVRDAREKSLV
jgi:hypothetical protein